MKQAKDPRFQTHIAEPRWQQVVSVIVVVAVVAVWVWLAFIRH
jgi:hypothetical protein